MTVYWSEFSWEAFATLVAGLAAVGAAWWVGRNQLEIQRRQTKLVENDLKIQLLGKRSTCVKEMRELFHTWNASNKLEHEQWRNFYNLMNEVELLFPKAVYEDISQAVDGTLWSRRHYERALQYYDKGKAEEAQEQQEKSWGAQDAVDEVMPRLLDAMISHTRIDAWE